MTTNKQLRELAEKATPGPWGWDGPVWGYDTENEAPWLIQEQGSGVVITGELQCSETNASYIASANPARILSLLDEVEALQVLCDRLQLEAQCHAQEARTANAIIAEIYRLVSGGTGEPGNWNGTEPVRRKLEELQAECERLRKDAETEQAIQRAAEVPPPGYRIEIEVENDAGSVALFAPGAIVECDFQGGIAEQIADAINAAMQGDQP